MRRNLIRLGLAAALIAAGLLSAAPLGAANHCDPRQNPDCRHDDPPLGEKKDHCHWERIGAPGSAATFGGAPANQILTLVCPNHILAHYDYGYKNCRFPVTSGECDQNDLLVVDLGKIGSPCTWRHSWQVYAPNVNVFTFWFKAHTWKDDNCDGKPDDWNAADPTGLNGCYWQNYFGPKSWENPPGQFWPYTAAPYGPVKDGKIEYCDYQIYEIQWRQFN